VSDAYKYCPVCATPLQWLTLDEDGGPKARLRCPSCTWTHWNNPTPVLAAVVEIVGQEGHVLLARNAAWPEKMFGLVAGFMEAGESPQEGIAREVNEETSLQVDAVNLIGVYDFQRMNQVIIAFHVVAHGEVVLSPELVEYKLVAQERVQCWPSGTGQALADFVRSRGLEPQWKALP
jgi:NAD+ diphosphatase